VKFLEILSLKNHKNFHVKNYLFFVIVDDPTKKCFNAKAFFLGKSPLLVVSFK